MANGRTMNLQINRPLTSDLTGFGIEYEKLTGDKYSKNVLRAILYTLPRINTGIEYIKKINMLNTFDKSIQIDIQHNGNTFPVNIVYNNFRKINVYHDCVTLSNERLCHHVIAAILIMYIIENPSGQIASDYINLVKSLKNYVPNEQVKDHDITKIDNMHNEIMENIYNQKFPYHEETLILHMTEPDDNKSAQIIPLSEINEFIQKIHEEKIKINKDVISDVMDII